MQVVVDVPERYLVGTNSEKFGRQLKLYTALLMYRTGELSAGAACEFADVDRFTFLDECKKLGIATLEANHQQLESDLLSLEGQ
jgi:predicted HTH domain antitoxin